MKVGILSDVHSNRIALDAVLDDMPPVEALLCAGDVVGYNPWPAECVDIVRDRATACVMGNHDRAVVSETPFAFNGMAQAGVEHARAELNDLQREWLARLPDSRLACDGRVRIVHGHPDDPDHYTYPEEFDADMLGDEDVLVMGHTHVQHHETYDEGIVMNPGSVGQPRDGDPRAAYAVLDLDDMTVDERRVEYDIGTVQEAVREAGLPNKIGTRLELGR
ncbi:MULTISPECIES: metallophosphoesterase family protein [unclassified Haladaptatus]|uniref:metallophosphoesterase family protein n=1 Tax=unclassified Haladaptatus TaxID=2622732 RepID=UPI00209C2960|nr:MULTISPECIES: metallophosphoesterase family protein [unclassified Haladaptatus]MCO8242478.1 metallophosphatase family protein [Haladaptatus sp. AB643]MCO8252235.1 metallophosphatase family protein [Haladaptatus sp. AB618]